MYEVGSWMDINQFGLWRSRSVEQDHSSLKARLAQFFNRCCAIVKPKFWWSLNDRLSHVFHGKCFSNLQRGQEEGQRKYRSCRFNSENYFRLLKKRERFIKSFHRKLCLGSLYAVIRWKNFRFKGYLRTCKNILWVHSKLYRLPRRWGIFKGLHYRNGKYFEK